MEYTLKELWKQFRSIENSVYIDTDDYNSAIYKGVKMVNDGETIKILCTASDIYKDVSDDVYYVFITEGVVNGVKAYQRERYEKQLLCNMHSQKAKETIKRKMNRI
jgi:hypothetical protein